MALGLIFGIEKVANAQSIIEPKKAQRLSWLGPLEVPRLLISDSDEKVRACVGMASHT